MEEEDWSTHIQSKYCQKNPSIETQNIASIPEFKKKNWAAENKD